MFEFLVDLLNRDIVPVSYAPSVGTSGDLSPLAFAMLVPLGLGKVYYKNTIKETKEVFKKEKITPIEYELKDA